MVAATGQMKELKMNKLFRNINNDRLHQPEYIQNETMYKTRNWKISLLLFLLKVVVPIVRVVQGVVVGLDVSGLYHTLFKPNLKETVMKLRECCCTNGH